MCLTWGADVYLHISPIAKQSGLGSRCRLQQKNQWKRGVKRPPFWRWNSSSDALSSWQALFSPGLFISLHTALSRMSCLWHVIILFSRWVDTHLPSFTPKKEEGRCAWGGTRVGPEAISHFLVLGMQSGQTVLCSQCSYLKPDSVENKGV